MTDIVKRLRQGIKASKFNDWDFERTEADMEEGADEIEKLREALDVTTNDCNEAFAENERLLAANRDVMLHWDVLKEDYDNLRETFVEKVANVLTGYVGAVCCHRTGGKNNDPKCECRNIARAALEGK